MKLRSALPFICFLISPFLPIFGEEGPDKILRLKLGDPGLKDKTMEVSPGLIYSAREGKPISFSKMLEEMKKCQLIYLGESHDSLPMHDIQLKVVQALHGQDKKISLGLEMFPASKQEVLTKWSLGLLTGEEFLREAGWYIHWNFNFGFYEKIFGFAKDYRIPVKGLNVPRELITKIRMEGWEALSEKEKELVPQPDLGHEEHRSLIRTIFETSEFPHQMQGPDLEKIFEGLYRSQSAWDEAMATYALDSLKKEEKRMVVLAGSGHLLYNLGISRRAYEKSRLPFKTVIAVVIPKSEKSVRISRSLADYVWGLAEEERPAFPSAGLSFKKFKGLKNLVIERKPIDGSAKGRDFEKGDIVLEVDGKKFFEINELRIYLSRLTWGEEVAFRLLRDAVEKEVVLKFE